MILYALVLITLIVIIFAYEYDVADIMDLPLVDIRDIPIRTGDIFITRCDYATQYEPVHYFMFGLCNHIFTGGVETHAGIVVNFDGKPYIYQVEYVPTYDYITESYRWKAPVLMDFYDYMMKYCGEIMYYPVKSELDVERTQQFIKSKVSTEFSIDQLDWGNTILKIPIKFNKKYTFCVKLVTDYLKYMGIIKPEYKSHHTNPQDLKRYIRESDQYYEPILVLNAYINYKLYDKKITKT